MRVPLLYALGRNILTRFAGDSYWASRSIPWHEIGPATLMMSADHATTWQPVGDALPFKPNGVTYSAFRNAFYVWQWDCKDVVLPNAIMRFGYDYRK